METGDKLESPQHPPQHVETAASAGSVASASMADVAKPHNSSLEGKPPIDEAVSKAFDNATSSNILTPELIAQITQSVIQQLQSTQNTPNLVSSHFVPPSSATIQSPIPQHPPVATNVDASERSLTPPSPTKFDVSQRAKPTSEVPSFKKGASPPSPERPGSPYSYVSNASNKSASLRPKGPVRLTTEFEETTLERIWGPLFDEGGRSTPRLGQFLRGLALHIIDDYEPKHSIVIRPEKMAKFYQAIRLPAELYPWDVVFDDEHSSISRIYRALSCEHHLVQDRLDERPDIPGLTASGFERWMTLLIQAHPSLEFERIQKAVLELPISNPDDRKERFPKEISPRLFPKVEDLQIRDLIEAAFVEHAFVDIPRRTAARRVSPSIPQAKPDPGPASQAPLRPSVSFADPESGVEKAPDREKKPYANVVESSPEPVKHTERERKPYSGGTGENARDRSPSEPLIGKPIERERKPYSAQVGGGKQYEVEDLRAPTKPRSETVGSHPIPRPTRSNSAASRARPISMVTAANANSPSMAHSFSSSNGSFTAGSGGRPHGDLHSSRRAPSAVPYIGRHRSPSFSRVNDARRSDSEIRGAGTSATAVHVGSPPRGESGLDEADTRRYFEEQARQRARRRLDEEAPRRERGYEDVARMRRSDEEDRYRRRDRLEEKSIPPGYR